MVDAHRLQNPLARHNRDTGKEPGHPGSERHHARAMLLPGVVDSRVDCKEGGAGDCQKGCLESPNVNPAYSLGRPQAFEKHLGSFRFRSLR